MFVAAYAHEIKAVHTSFESSLPRGPFLAEIRMRCSIHARAVANSRKDSTGCGGKLKAPPVKQKSGSNRSGDKEDFQADRKGGQMDYPSLRWRRKSSSGSEFR